MSGGEQAAAPQRRHLCWWPCRRQRRRQCTTGGKAWHGGMRAAGVAELWAVAVVMMGVLTLAWRAEAVTDCVVFVEVFSDLDCGAVVATTHRRTSDDGSTRQAQEAQPEREQTKGMLMGCCSLQGGCNHLTVSGSIATTTYHLWVNCEHMTVAVMGNNLCEGQPTLTWGGNLSSCGSLAPILSFHTTFLDIGNATTGTHSCRTSMADCAAASSAWASSLTALLATTMRSWFYPYVS